MSFANSAPPPRCAQTPKGEWISTAGTALLAANMTASRQDFIFMFMFSSSWLLGWLGCEQ